VAVHIGDGEIDVRADLSGAQKDIDTGIKKSLSSAEDDFDKAGKKGGSKFGGAFTGAIAGVLTGGGIQQLAGFLGDSLQDAADAARIDKIVTNTIEQTGAAARGVTKAAFAGVAGDIAKALVIDDDDIAQGLAPLLRIPDLTKPVFDELAKVAADTSAATGKDLEGVSKALSKLGTDPEGAIGALKALGVTVEDTTKETVKGLVEQGDSAGALNVLLDQLKGRYEGAAKAAGEAASPQQKLGVFFGDLREKIGGGLLSGLSKLGDALKGVQGIFAILFKGDFIGRSKTFGIFEDDPIIEKLFQFREVMLDVFATVKRVWPDIQATISEVLTAVVSIIGAVVDIIQTIWRNFGDQITTVVVSAFTLIRSTIANVMQVIQGIIEVVTGIIHGDWGRVWEGIKDIFGGVFDQIIATLRNAATIIPAILSAALELLGSIVSSALDKVLGFFADLPGNLFDLFVDAHLWLFHVGQDIVNGLIDGIGSLAHAVTDALLALIPGPLKRFASRLGIGSPSKVFAGFGRNIGQGLVVGMDSMHRPVSDAAGALAGATLSPTSVRTTNQSVTVNALGAGQDDLVEMIARRVSLNLSMAAGL
jgi:hypothetical protein